MGQRMFVAVVPPDPVREDLAAFLDARPGMPWIHPEQWHVTLAFLPAVPEHRVDDLVDRLAAGCRRRTRFEAALCGAGAFPDPTRAAVLWLGVDPARHTPDSELHRLAVNARAAAVAAGCAVDGKAFRAHLSVARLKRPLEATKWLRVLDTYVGPRWVVEEIELVASFLGEGPGRRPRYETVARLPLGDPAERHTLGSCPA